MNREQATQVVKDVIGQIVRDKGETVSDIDEKSVLLGGNLPIDSLDLGAIIVELERRCSHDPFQHGIINFRTVGELADLYVR
jgi:acyl carrier protein